MEEPKPISLRPDENQMNQMIYAQSAPVATAKGYIVKTNKSTVDGESPFQVSLFFRSRPDLVLYHKKELHAYIVTHA